MPKNKGLYPGGTIAQPAGADEGRAAEDGQLCLDPEPGALGPEKLNKRDQEIVRHDMQPKKGKAVR